MGRAARLAPEEATIHYHHGVVLQDAGHKTEAREALDQALRMAPDADWADDARGRLGRL